MKGFVPFDIPTKKYIAAYVKRKHGNPVIITKENSTIGQKLYDLLEHSTNERANQYQCKHYTEKIRLHIPMRLYKRRGCWLNKSNIKNLNLFIEAELKERFHLLMDDLIEIFPSFQNNLPEVRRRLGIDIESWSDDSMQKSYYRYRKQKKEKFFLDKYKNN